MDQQRRNLSIGLQGDDVKLLLRQLVQLGFVIPADELRASLFGQGTHDAIAALQKEHWLNPTGVFDQKTAQLVSVRLRLSKLEVPPNSRGERRDQALRPIVAPINPGDSGDTVTNLHNAIILLLKRRIIRDTQDHPTLEDLGRLADGLLTESSNSQFDVSTRQLIIVFQRQEQLDILRGIVDEATATKLNDVLKSIDAFASTSDPAMLIVRGSVSDAGGKPLPGAVVRAFDRDLRKEPLIGEAETDELGFYSISYSSSQFSFGDEPQANAPRLIVRAFFNDQQIGDDVIRPNPKREEVVDFKLSSRDSEWENLSAAILPLLKEQGEDERSLPPWELNQTDFNFISEETGLDRDRIQLWSLAFVVGRAAAVVKPSQDSKGDSEVTGHAFPASGFVDGRLTYSIFYAWFRLGLPTDLAGLWNASPENLLTTLKAAIDQRIIPRSISKDLEGISARVGQIKAALTEQRVEPAKGPSLEDVLDTMPVALTADKREIVARAVADKARTDVSLATRLKKGGLADKEIAAVERTLSFQKFADNFLPLVKALQDEGFSSLRDFALKTNKDTLTRKIIDNKAHPEGIPPNDFAEALYSKLFQAEPTAVLSNMLADPEHALVGKEEARSDVATFLSNLPPSFNIKTTSVYEAFQNEGAFEGINPERHEDVRTELKSLQRVAALSPAPEVVPVLIKANLTSALVVSDQPETQFVQALSKQLSQNGETVARQVYTNAVSARIRNEQALLSMKEAKQGSGVSFIDKGLKQNFGNNDFNSVLTKNNLSWDLLFGDTNFCECGECTSVYGAANYFVELLQYLRNNNLDPDAVGALSVSSNPKDISKTPLRKLFDRRPDLQCLQLTCANTNTMLPYVDLVNEVMESYVVFHKTLPFNVSEDETSAELLAQPQHTEYKAYEQLHNAVYPFSLPYHQPIDAARIYLKFLRTSRYELMDTFRAVRNSQFVLEPLNGLRNYVPMPTAAQALTATLDEHYRHSLERATDAEYLNLTQEEYLILTKEAFVAKEYWDAQVGNPHTADSYSQQIGVKPVHEYYGYASEAAMLSADENARGGLTFVKDQFLKRTGLEYAELVDLLKTQSLNLAMPREKALSIMDRIRFSYRYLQTLVNRNPGISVDEKYRMVGTVIVLITNPAASSALDHLLGTEDPCGSQNGNVALTGADIKQWVERSFESIGKIIVLDNGARCIDGKLLIRMDNLIDTGFRIQNCQILNQNGKKVGSIDKATGLVSFSESQGTGDWSKLVFTGNNGDQGTFISTPGGVFLVTPAPVDNCDLEPVRLNHLDGTPLTVAEYDRIHRFIRLWRKLGWTIQETDDSVAALTGGSFELTPEFLHQLAAVKKLSEQFGLELRKLLALWANIGTAGPNSLYNRLFLKHNADSVSNPFRADADGRYLANSTLQLQDYAAFLTAALNLKADELSAIMSYAGLSTLTLENVSTLYRYRLLSKLVGVGVVNLIDAVPLFSDPFASPRATVLFVEQWKRIEDAGFDYRQLNYITAGKDDLKKPVGPTSKTLFQLAKTLYDGLNAITQAHQDVNEALGIVATPDLVKREAALLYDQATVDNILGLLEGTKVYSAGSAPDVKDLLRPIPLIPPATNQDYEFLQFDNYPLLRDKVRYDGKTGSLQIKGVLTDLEEKGSWLFAVEDFVDASSLIGKLVDPTSDTTTREVSEFLWSTFSTTTQTTLSDHTIDIAQQRDALIKEFDSLVQGPSIAANFNHINLSLVTSGLLAKNPTGDDLIRLNRLLIEDAYPLAVGKNKQVGFKTIRQNIQPPLSLDAATTDIEAQRSSLFDEIFSNDFAAFKQDCFAGDSNGQPADPTTNLDTNTAPVKCKKFLEIFLPYLRMELTHRFVINTLSGVTSLSNDLTELLLTKILKSRQTITGPLQPLYDFFATINQEQNVIATGWDGYLIPPADGQYILIVRGSGAAPDLNLDGQELGFTVQTGAAQEWRTAPQKLLASKVYKLTLNGVKLDKLYWKSATSTVEPLPHASLLPAFAQQKATAAYVQLQKAALLVKGFNLSADEIQYLSDHPADFDSLDFNAISLIQFLRLEAYTRLRNSLGVGKINIFEFLQWTTNNSGVQPNLTGKIEDLSGWKRDRVGQLTQKLHFNLLESESFRNEVNLLKLQKALVIADRIGVSIDLLFDWANPSPDFATCRTCADAIQHAIRAQYNEDEWDEVVKPLSDALRVNQRDALIAFLLEQPEIIKWGIDDADGLFEYFLIDVQMDACMETSRIVQAISSVQLFIQRCFLGLEEEHSNIAPDLLDRGRWEWMQRYRVWEANRKVFLYPENWIESNLRDDKSAFFKELESELLQKDINKQNVEDALKSYLYKLDEVANMEAVGVYVEKVPYVYAGQTYEKDVKLHIFARTRNAPYAFYYRYKDLSEGNWYPWEKMQVDIPSYDREDAVEVTNASAFSSTGYKSNPNFKHVIGNGCFLTPVVWNARLLVFFPQFVRKTKPNDDVADSKSIVDLSEDSTSSSRPIEYWEIKMGWSEYRNSKWTPKQLSKDAIYDIPTSTNFWKAFNDYQKAESKLDAATKKQQQANGTYNNERNRLKDVYKSPKYYNNPVTIIYLSDPYYPDSTNGITNYSIFGTAKNVGDGAENSFTKSLDTSHPCISAWEKLQEASQAVIDANSNFTSASTALGNASAPPPALDISRYVFAPVISDTGNLLGIKVDYARDVNGTNQHDEKGLFEFDGSSVTASPKASYTYDRLLTRVDTFNHYDSNIISLQEDDFTGHLFNDGGPTTYTFQPLNDAETISFHHSDARKLLGVINTQSLDAFYRFPNESPDRDTDKDDVFGGYDQDSNTQTPNIYHELKRPYSIYNWELFFHTPMMLADALSKSQQFEEAMKWYHFVFNPMASGTADNRFWQFSPLKDTDSRRVLDHIFNSLKPNKSDADINEWRNNPFAPHVVARSRPVAYMKWVVMKYVDNLIAWGDYLFRQDTIESINQATQLYVLAGHILGQRPQVIPKRGKTKPETYLSLLGKWDAFSNAMVELEMALPFSSQITQPFGNAKGVTGLANIFGFASSTYFCIPNNPKLTGYWDTIADRLFKIRHCENIEGVFRQLPLFEPPIDPSLLVKAAAEGLSVASVLNDLNTPMPNYRFYYLLQKALELCGELKSMGSAMLAALEKKDGEELSRVRARHESGLANLMMDVKKKQLEEAQKTLESLQQNRKTPEHRMKYYLNLIGEDLSEVPDLEADFNEIANMIEAPIDESGLKLIRFEKEDMDKASEAAGWQIGIGITETLAGILNIIPVFAADVKPFGMGAGGSFGGSNLGSAASAIARGMQTYSTNLSFQSSSAGKKGSFLRSLQERVMQANAAGYEIKQIDKQILAQQIRIELANLDITNQQKQIDNAQEIEEFLRNKYTNEELYSWMKDTLSTLYHQVYSLAFELAKKGEKLFRFERGVTSSSFIQSGYWDAGYNGLLAGEQLFVSLKQLEAAYHETRGYDYEIIKHVSLRQVNPIALLQLKESGKCEFSLPEVLFDIDYPGHYKRRIKSVAITIPCVVGPYVGLNGSLRLLENKFRNSGIATKYPEKTDEADDRFQSYLIPISAIATSSAQNDSGMFELNFKDERYLPFEGAGAVSRWRFELPAPLRQFNYDTIADVVIHLRYTSVEGGAALKLAAQQNVAAHMSSAEQVGRDEGLFAILDLKRDFPTQWHQLFNQNQQSASWDVTHAHFPYLFNARQLEITGTKIFLRSKDGTAMAPLASAFTLNGSPAGSWTINQDIGLTEGTIDLDGSPIGSWTIDRGPNPVLDNSLDDLLLVIKYRTS